MAEKPYMNTEWNKECCQIIQTIHDLNIVPENCYSCPCISKDKKKCVPYGAYIGAWGKESLPVWCPITGGAMEILTFFVAPEPIYRYIKKKFDLVLFEKNISRDQACFLPVNKQINKG